MDALQDLDPSRWFKVLDFIGYLKERGSREQLETGRRELTARDLLQSGLVGLWAAREDIGDNHEFARQLRHEAEHRRRKPL